MRRHGAGGGEVGTAGDTDREGLERPVERARRERRDDRGIQAAREERADLDVRHQPLAHRGLQDQAQLAPDRLRRLARRQLGRTLRHAVPCAHAIALSNSVPGPIASTSRTGSPSNAFSSDAKASPSSSRAMNKGLDAERIARRDDALGRRQHEREHAVQPRDPARLCGAEQMQDGLAVALRREGGLAQDRAQVGVVVDLAIGHQHVVGAVDRLHAVLGADDREPAMRHQGRHARQPG